MRLQKAFFSKSVHGHDKGREILYIVSCRDEEAKCLEAVDLNIAVNNPTKRLVFSQDPINWEDLRKMPSNPMEWCQTTVSDVQMKLDVFFFTEVLCLACSSLQVYKLCFRSLTPENESEQVTFLKRVWDWILKYPTNAHTSDVNFFRVIAVCLPSQSASSTIKKKAHIPLRTSWISPKCVCPVW